MERFWSKVDKSAGREGCWNWTAFCAPTEGGKHLPYGRFKISGNKCELAHRFSWRIANGEIPDGLKILHSCDNPKCVNPKHLFAGTQKDNVEDAISKGRHMIPAAGCVGGQGSVKCDRSTSK